MRECDTILKTVKNDCLARVLRRLLAQVLRLLLAQVLRLVESCDGHFSTPYLHLEEESFYNARRSWKLAFGRCLLFNYVSLMLFNFTNEWINDGPVARKNLSISHHSGRKFSLHAFLALLSNIEGSVFASTR